MIYVVAAALAILVAVVATNAEPASLSSAPQPAAQTASVEAPSTKGDADCGCGPATSARGPR